MRQELGFITSQALQFVSYLCLGEGGGGLLVHLQPGGLGRALRAEGGGVHGASTTGLPLTAEEHGGR